MTHQTHHAHAKHPQKAEHKSAHALKHDEKHEAVEVEAPAAELRPASEKRVAGTITRRSQPGFEDGYREGWSEAKNEFDTTGKITEMKSH